MKLLMLFALMSTLSFSQEGNIWHFGNGAGLDFNVPVNSISSNLTTVEGVATISDASGSLLFSTDGSTVRDANGGIMPNGIGLNGNSSATQSAIIIPHPGNAIEYFIFTVGAIENGNPVLSYSIVDMTVTGNGTPGMPAGDVVTINTFLNDSVVEKISAVEMCDGSGYWVVAHQLNSSDFLAYDVTTIGVNSTPTVSSVGISHNAITNTSNALNAVGYMKFAPSGTQLALVYRGMGQPGLGGAYLYDFNNTPTGGTVSSEVFVPGSNAISSLYGIEFSGDGNQLYIGDLNRVWRSDISGAPTAITAVNLTGGGGTNNTVRALQLAPDGDIYVSLDNSSFIGRIDTPNSPIAQLDQQAVQLAAGTNCRFGLPTFVQSIFSPDDVTATAEIDTCGKLNFTGTTTLNGTITWDWNFGDPSTILDVSTLQNPSYTYSSSGTFTVTLTVTATGGTCPQTQTVTIDVTPDFSTCCPAAIDPAYIEVTSNITTNTFWIDKIYIPDNTIITVSNNAILDITNVDVVFGECAGIDFTDGAMLRSNNSVYRPCDPNGTWRGINFSNVNPNQPNNPTGIVNESTFKNAQRALRTFDQKDYDLRITNNLFSNCKASVYLGGGKFLRSITGNTFLLDDLAPDFESSDCNWGTAGDRYGIYSDFTEFASDISQNDFIVQDSENPNFYGIESINSDNIVISSNQFTDLFRSISLFRNTNSLIESNTIAVGNSFAGFEHQIAATSCSSTSIRSNDLTSTAQFNADGVSSNAAIYCSLSNSYAIKENHIEGFETGIQCESARSVYITENTITDCRFYGIYMNNLLSSYALCNSINMDAQENDGAIGIGYFTTYSVPTEVQIGSNCIFETNTAIHLESTILNSIMPLISNNYLYNYSYAGIENINITGNIGSSPSPALGAGRNSFISNNGLGLTGDIITNTTPLISYGNFGVNFISAGISLMGNNVNSTASCGSQIDLANSANGYLEICDDISDAVLNLILENNELTPNFESELAKFSLQEVLYVMRRTQFGSNPNAIHSLYQTANEKLDLSLNEQKWLEYQYLLMTNEFVQAETVLTSIQGIDQDENNLLFMEGLLLNVNSQSSNLISEQEINALQTIAMNESFYSHMATAILRKNFVVDNYEFYTTKTPSHSTIQDLIEVSNVSFIVYPNPTDGSFTFEYAFTEEENSVLNVHDITGKLISTSDLNYQYTAQTIDLSGIPNGIYTLSIVTDGSVQAHSKLVKK